MENAINIKDFINQYNAATDKQEIINNLRIRKYIPIELKINTAMIIIRDNFKIENNMVIKNTPMLYVLEKMSIITLYCPGLQIDMKHAINDFDALVENNLLDVLTNEIGQDAKEFSTVFEMTYNDYIENMSSPYAYFGRFVNVILSMLDGKTNEFFDILKETNTSELLEILKNINVQPEV